MLVSCAAEIPEWVPKRRCLAGVSSMTHSPPCLHAWASAFSTHKRVVLQTGATDQTQLLASNIDMASSHVCLTCRRWCPGEDVHTAKLLQVNHCHSIKKGIKNLMSWSNPATPIPFCEMLMCIHLAPKEAKKGATTLHFVRSGLQSLCQV
jgi:hypothetical protein